MQNIAKGCAAAIIIIALAPVLAGGVLLWSVWEDVVPYLLWGAGGLVFMTFALTIAYLHNRQQRRERTYIDGALPIMRRRRHIWRSDIPRPLAVWSLLVGEEFFIDPNRMMSPAWSFDAFGRVAQVEPAGGWQMQHQYNLAMEHTNGLRSVFPGHEANTHLFGRDAAPPRLPARALTPRAEPPRLMPPVDFMDEPPQLVEPALTPANALERSQDGLVHIGQAQDNTRRIATWDTNSASTLGIFGANGTGKSTTVATMAALAMVRWGWKLWILDGKDAGDWDEFAGVAAVAPVGQSNIDDVMGGIWDEYERRAAMMSEYRARRYHHLPDDVQAEFPQWGVVFEEFGATRLALSSKSRERLDRCMGILCQKARYTGWHGVFIDQRPSDYTNEMKGNLKAIACFQLLMNQGHAVNAYHADKLAPRGEFEMDGGRYFAFHAEPLVQPTLANRGVRGAFVNVPATNGYERPVQVANVRERGGDEGPETLVSIYERTRSWDAVAKDFFRSDPTRTQADLRRLMVLISADGRGPDAFKGEANRLYHAYNPHGQNYRG